MQLGISYLWSWHTAEVDYAGDGPDLRASLSPFGPISLDLGYAFLDGDAMYRAAAVTDRSARRSTIGATLFPVGFGATRLGFRVDYNRLSDLYVSVGGEEREYTDSGITGELLVTWF